MQFLLVMSMLTLAFRIQSAKSSPITITVPDDYPTVQGAINAASPGDTVYVKAGAYVENIVLNKTVALIGEDKDTTIIDGNASGDCVHITVDNTVLDNFTVRNGGARPGTAYSSVRLSSNKNNITSNNLVGSWCGVRIDDGCEGNVISQNYISGNLNGISGELWYNSKIIGNDITDNLMGMWIGPYTSHNTVSFNNIEKSWSEGIYAYAPSYSTFEGNNLTDNNLGGFWAGLTIGLQPPFSFGNKFFHNNFADHGKQIEVYEFQEPQSIVWDDGYPSGGNYWRDYNGTDIYSGPFQNLTGSDGIGDTPYIISTSNVDSYPFVNPYVPPPLVASISPVSASIYFGQVVTFTSTTSGGTPPYSYQWCVNDTRVSGATSSIWTFASRPLGNYNVSLNVTDISGNTVASNQALVTVAMGQTPVASFTYSPIPAVENFTTTFDASSSAAITGNITSYVWDFGDGNVAGTPDPVVTHVYVLYGSYNVTLTVENSASMTNSTWRLIDVLRHDVTVVDVTPYRSWVYEGWLASINAAVTNVGNFTENAIVNLYYNITASEIVGTQNVTLAPGQSQTIIFTWNTTGVPCCLNYTMTAVASIPNDNYPADNTLAGGTIKVRILGDINGDDKVDMRDISNAAKAFGSYLGGPGWNPDADVNRDGKIDLRDVAIVAKHFGQHYP
jgi:PKD repeat protein